MIFDRIKARKRELQERLGDWMEEDGKLVIPCMRMTKTAKLPTRGSREAAMFLALYRCMDYGFSADMLVKLVKLVTEVRSEFNDDKKKLWKACQEETGINLMEYERKGVIE